MARLVDVAASLQEEVIDRFLTEHLNNLLEESFKLSDQLLNFDKEFEDQLTSSCTVEELELLYRSQQCTKEDVELLSIFQGY